MTPLQPKEEPRRGESPGLGDDVACVNCGAVALDTGLECTECGHDNWQAVTGKPFRPAMSADGGKDG